ncbi:MAG TPA: M14 family zinc carboxypeptidase [Marmoricola sp.]|nr:M14 family zinc carboxypeptidase [Marmoricola sp.]
MTLGRIAGTTAAALALLGSFLASPTPSDAATSLPAAGSARVTAAPAARTSAVLGVEVFGHSLKGRALRAYHLGDPTSPNKVVFIASIHGDEPGPQRLLVNLMHGAPITGADIWVIPRFNADGLARNTRTDARGVDLNRNYPINWIRQRGKYNSGRRPASEPETRAMMRFLSSIKPNFIVSMHQPLKGVDTSYGKARSLALRLVDGLHLPAKVFNCNSGCHGTLTEWYNHKFPGAALTVEYGYKISHYQARVSGPDGLLAAVFASR